MGRGHYGNLAIMTLVSFIAMFIRMYAMIDRLRTSILNRAYMAGLMAAPMVLIELAVMRSMCPDMRMNLTFAGVAALALVLFLVGIRAQTAAGRQLDHGAHRARQLGSTRSKRRCCRSRKVRL